MKPKEGHRIFFLIQPPNIIGDESQLYIVNYFVKRIYFTTLIKIKAAEGSFKRSSSHLDVMIEFPHSWWFHQPHALTEGKTASSWHSRRILNELTLQRISTKFQICTLVWSQLVVIRSRKYCYDLRKKVKIPLHTCKGHHPQRP